MKRVSFSVQRYNCIAEFRFCHMMSSVCLSVCLSAITRMYCDKTTANSITCFFTIKQLRVSTVSIVSLKTKLEEAPLDRGLNLCWGGRSHHRLHTYRLHMTSHHPGQPEPITVVAESYNCVISQSPKLIELIWPI